MRHADSYFNLAKFANCTAEDYDVCMRMRAACVSVNSERISSIRRQKNAHCVGRRFLCLC